MIPLRDRILGALALQPMTIADLAVALWLATSTVRHSITGLHESGDVMCAGTIHRKNGAPRKLWRIA